MTRSDGIPNLRNYRRAKVRDGRCLLCKHRHHREVGGTLECRFIERKPGLYFVVGKHHVCDDYESSAV